MYGTSRFVVKSNGAEKNTIYKFASEWTFAVQVRFTYKELDLGIDADIVRGNN